MAKSYLVKSLKNASNKDLKQLEQYLLLALHRRDKAMATRGRNKLLPWKLPRSRSELQTIQTIQGKRQSYIYANLHPVNPSTVIKEFPTVSGMSQNPCLTHTLLDLPIGGRIAHFYPNWLNITNDPWVLESVLGHKLEFVQFPHQSVITTMHLTNEQMKIIDSEVLALQQKGAICKVLEPNGHYQNQFISPLFTVPQKGGGHRPVINLKGLNVFIEYQHFKMEGISMLKDLLKQGDFLTKIDIKDAYLNVPIWTNHQKFLRFMWQGQLWQFLCLPFGLASAPRTFTKLLKPVVAQLRKRGVRLIMYLDDILIMSISKDIAIDHTALTTNLLTSLVFVIKKKNIS
jgi:hypothetical protein